MNTTEEKIGIVIGVLVMSILLLTVMPLLAIWAVNTLFPTLNIAYNFWNWLAMTCLGIFFRAWGYSKK